MIVRFLSFGLMCLVAVSCARPAAHIAFDLELEELNRRASKEDRRAIAAEFLSMAKRSYKSSDRVELRLRAVDLLIQEGDASGATEILVDLKYENLDRPHAGLVQLRYARIVERVLNRPAKALRMYTEVIVENVDNMASRLGLRDVRIMLLGGGQDVAWSTYLSKLMIEVPGTRFEHVLWVHRATQHIEDGQELEAIALILPIHRDHKGSTVWYQVSTMLTSLFKKLNMPEREAEILEGLANHLERTSMLGSYDSALYTRGELRLAELYCQNLDRPKDGIRWMIGFERRHPYSILRDDAMWHLAECYREAEDKEAQKEALCSILERFPLTKNARRARKVLGLPIGPGLGGSGDDGQGDQPCGPLPLTEELAAGLEQRG